MVPGKQNNNGAKNNNRSIAGELKKNSFNLRLCITSASLYARLHFSNTHLILDLLLF